jgi:hypothetical protein
MSSNRLIPSRLPTEFLRKFAEMIGDIQTARPDATAIEAWFQDEAGVGQKGTLTRRWALRGSRPRAIRDHRVKSA